MASIAEEFEGKLCAQSDCEWGGFFPRRRRALGGVEPRTSTDTGSDRVFDDNGLREVFLSLLQSWDLQSEAGHDRIKLQIGVVLA